MHEITPAMIDLDMSIIDNRTERYWANKNLTNCYNCSRSSREIYVHQGDQYCSTDVLYVQDFTFSCECKKDEQKAISLCAKGNTQYKNIRCSNCKFAGDPITVDKIQDNKSVKVTHTLYPCMHPERIQPGMYYRGYFSCNNFEGKDQK